MTTLHKTIEEYLKTRNNRAERSVLNRFKEYMQKRRPEVQVKDVTVNDFQSFLKWLKVSAVSETIYASRLRPFQQFIGLSPTKIKKNRNPENDSSKLEKEQNEHAKTKKELADKDEESRLRWETIKEKDVKINEQDGIIKAYTSEKDKEKEKECVQCPKIVTLNRTIISNKATFDKEKEENRAIIDELKYKVDTFVSNSGEIEEIQHLETKKAQLDQDILNRNKIMGKQQIIQLRCFKKRFSFVPFGNDCQECDDSSECEPYTELMKLVTITRA
jgi:hypothetical protein